jgi:hypothetical protein
MHACMHAYMHACIRTCMHTYTNTQVTDLGDGTYAFDYLPWDAGMHMCQKRPRNRLEGAKETY